MSDPIVMDGRLIVAQIDRLKAIYPELAEDDALLLDTIEGQTHFDRVISTVIDAYLDAVSMNGAIADRIESLKERSERYDRRSEAYKALAFALVEASGQRKLTLPQATLSISTGRKVLELDEDFNAQGYMRIKAEPIKADILAALNNGDPIPGARIVQSPDHLSIRTK